MLKWNFVILLYLGISYIDQHGDCSGRVLLEFLTYKNSDGKFANGTCCDGFYANSSSLCKPCDYYIAACLVDIKTSLCTTNNITTDPVNNSAQIQFNSTTYKQPNTFRLNFTKSLGRVDLLFTIYDEDKYDLPQSEDDCLFIMRYTLHTFQSISPGYSIGHAHTQHDSNASLTFRYSIECDDGFYKLCSDYCPSDPLRYTCNRNGVRICKSGWKGSNCSVQDCFNKTCENGGTCSYNTFGSSCSCETNFTGIFCETQVVASMDIDTTTQPVARSSLNFSTKPDKTETSLENLKEPSEDNIGVYIGASIGAVLGLAVITGGIVYLMIRKKNQIHSKSAAKTCTQKQQERSEITDENDIFSQGGSEK